MKELLSARKFRTTLEQQRQLTVRKAQANQATQTAGQAKIWPDIDLGPFNYTNK